jgi:hypothetical protein
MKNRNWIYVGLVAIVVAKIIMDGIIDEKSFQRGYKEGLKQCENGR